ncbi:MAG TPA: response regulator transcription factor [Ktedonobacterales bacterium]|nr:response regulator transcription factor [Ktedonobacterales bacterium]
MTRILIVDDEPTLVELLDGYLRHEGYDVVVAADGPDAVRRAQETQPDLIILDVLLPGFDGIEACRQIRRFSDAYVLMLTARTEEIDKIVGLTVGADDYVTKPFSPREVVARVKVLLRRPRNQTSALAAGAEGEGEELPVLRCGDLSVDEGRHEVRRRGEELALTAREFALLLTLARHRGRVFTRAQLLEHVWGDEYYDDHVVDVHIANLRKKLGDDPADQACPHYIETVRGVGYRFAAHRDRE